MKKPGRSVPARLLLVCGIGKEGLLLGGGFLQVEHGDVLLVTDTALEAAAIDTDTVQAALERAQKALRDRASVLSREEQAYLEACIAKQLAMMEYSRIKKR